MCNCSHPDSYEERRRGDRRRRRRGRRRKKRRRRKRMEAKEEKEEGGGREVWRDNFVDSQSFPRRGVNRLGFRIVAG